MNPGEGAGPGAELGAGGSERELKSVLASLVEHSETLVRQEIALGKAELDLRMQQAKQALVRGAICAGLFHAAYLTTLATLVLLFSEWVAPWVASLIIALVASAGAAVFTLLGKEALQRIKHPPERHPSETRPILQRRAHT